MKESEQAFLEMVDEGKIKVTKRGEVFNTNTGNQFLSLNNRGYIRVSCWWEGKIHYILAHRLVYLCLKGEIPDGHTINHKDGVKTNNHPKNLESVTFQKNMEHAYKTGLIDVKARYKASYKARFGKEYTGYDE